jgi:hypothetical protein
MSVNVMAAVRIVDREVGAVPEQEAVVFLRAIASSTTIVTRRLGLAQEAVGGEIELADAHVALAGEDAAVEIPAGARPQRPNGLPVGAGPMPR